MKIFQRASLSSSSDDAVPSTLSESFSARTARPGIDVAQSSTNATHLFRVFGVVVAVHVLAFAFIFTSPGCSSSPRNVPTPDATTPSAAAANNYNALPAEAATPVELQPAYAGTPGRATPTRPGSPNAAAITPAKSVANVSAVVPYTIQKGDSLWSIAKKNNISVAELTKANNLGGGASLQPGKKLMIPVKHAPAPAAETSLSYTPTTAPVAATEAPVRPSNEVVRHVVASGESLGVIARKYQVTVGDLAAANNITDPAKIRIGQPLVIPGGKGAKTAGKPASKPVTAAKPAATPAPTATPEPAPAAATTTFELAPPPAGQDLDAGLKESTTTEVPTIKVEEPAPAATPAN